jgi:hypothetical protein
MAISTIRETVSLETIGEELVFTETRLLVDELAKEFAPPISQLLVRQREVSNGQFAAKHEEVAAQAAVSAADDQLDDLLLDLARELMRVVSEDPRSPRYARYFSDTPSAIVRLGLESETARVRGWVDSLCSEPEASLQALGARLRKAIEGADQVLDRRRKAGAARSDHRVREIASLIDDVNSARRSLYGTLTKKAADTRLPRDWADRFFRHNSRDAKEAPPTPPSPATSAKQ